MEKSKSSKNKHQHNFNLSLKDNYKEAVSSEVFHLISECAQELGIEAYVIGGWVRDLILGRPSKDIDVVTVGSGIELAKKVAKRSKEKTKFSYFKNFGTAMIKTKSFEIEFVGARKESYNRNSRKPIVEDGTIEDDQLRRDFTINALSISLNSSNYGDLIDPFGGIQHLKDGIIKTPLDPDTTYSDDPLRMMRAIRFATQLGFRIEDESFQAIHRNRKRLEIISKERITEEMNKMMLSPKPSIGFILMFKTQLLHEFFPEMIALHGVEEVNGQKHKDNFYHTLEVVDNISRNTDNIWLRYAALLHDIGKPKTKRFDEKIGYSFHGHEALGAKMAYRIFKRLRLPLDSQLKYVQKLVFMSSRPIVISKDEVTDSAVRRLLFDAGEDIQDLMILCEADITTKNPRRFKRYLNNFKIVRLKLKEVEEKDRIMNFQPPVDGEEIMNYFGLKPCKTIGDIKNAIKEAILEGEIQNEREEAWAYMQKKGAELGLTPSNKN